MEDRADFRLLVARHSAFVYSAAFARLRDHHLAEDATQTVFLLLSRKPDAAPSGPELRSWLLHSVKHVCGNLIRGETRRRLRESRSARPILDARQDSSESADVSKLVHEALDGLDEEDRRLLILRYLEGSSLTDVGDRFGISLHAAAMRIGRALEKVQLLLRRRGVAVAAPAIVGALPAALAPAASGAAVALKVAGLAAAGLALAAVGFFHESSGTAAPEETPVVARMESDRVPLPTAPPKASSIEPMRASMPTAGPALPDLSEFRAASRFEQPSPRRPEPAPMRASRAPAEFPLSLERSNSAARRILPTAWVPLVSPAPLPDLPSIPLPFEAAAAMARIGDPDASRGAAPSLPKLPGGPPSGASDSVRQAMDRLDGAVNQVGQAGAMVQSIMEQVSERLDAVSRIRSR